VTTRARLSPAGSPASPVPFDPLSELPLRFVTGTALFDGHDASIHVFRRLLQRGGAEVVHLGHNRGAGEIAAAALEEDADAIAVSSYQGGHNEFFRYLVDLLREAGRGDIRVFGGGGGVIRPHEAAALEAYGVARIYSPGDDRVMGIEGVVDDMLRDAAAARAARSHASFDALIADLADGDPVRRNGAAARLISFAENEGLEAADRAALAELVETSPPVLGITGTGGAGKSSVLDELLLRFRSERPDLGSGPVSRIGVLAVDPSKRRTGGALLGDRIRLNAVEGTEVFVRSVATRSSGTELATVVDDALLVLRAAGCGLVVVETGGIGQGDSRIVDISDFSLYVMTSEYGAESQLEKIDMLDLADAVALNKADHPGAEDALFAVRRAFRRARSLPRHAPAPVVPTVASRFADPGIDGLYALVRDGLAGVEPALAPGGADRPDDQLAGVRLIPPARAGYLAEIADALRSERERVAGEAARAGTVEHLEATLDELRAAGGADEAAAAVESRLSEVREELHPESRQLLEDWPDLVTRYQAPTYQARVRDRLREYGTHRETLSGTRIPRVALPQFGSRGDTLRFLLDENLPGHYPFTAGVFPFRREEESPRRQFAGEGGPARTNRRFHLLAESEAATRLSVAFDSVTLYGDDPARRPDIFGKIGEGGVSIATLDDMCEMFEGFRLTDPATSVSMTINGPAPVLLAMFLNAAVLQEVRVFESEQGRPPSPGEYEDLKARTLRAVRGTVQADILKEDQAQNTCIFSTGFALRLMGDVQEYFIQREVRNFYSVSISGYHIAEAGANPITQLAFTLANGFTYVEYYLARGLPVDAFAPNLSFFFSNGLDPEYAVMARVARRIWARAMKLRYGAGERSQKFKVHIQTSGRSLHAQEVQFNDIRTTLQALIATNDNCNSLHTNAYDEAITTPTPESVRRAVAIQKIIRAEFGMAWNENPLSGSFIAGRLTDLVEEAVLTEFDRLNARGGVLASMERQYQRNRIQEESLLYETRKDSGEIPIIGVNTFLAEAEDGPPAQVPLARATDGEKEAQVLRVEGFRGRHATEAPEALRRLQEVARSGGNVFEELMETVKVASLGQITGALYEVGGRYRRAM
jgi:methylmalonyl-CoA mutase